LRHGVKRLNSLKELKSKFPGSCFQTSEILAPNDCTELNKHRLINKRSQTDGQTLVKSDFTIFPML